MNCLAQSAEPTFEVASVRLADPGASNVGQGLQTSPGLLTIRHTALFGCIMFAWQVPAQVIGPDWIHDVKLDIVGKAPTPVGDRELYLMPGALLEERVGLRAHFEKREIPVFVLTLAKDGPKFAESTTEGPPGGALDKGVMVFQRFSMAEFDAEFSKILGRPVISAAGLKGRYEFRLDMSAFSAADEQDREAAVNVWMTAMQTRPGFKLEDRKESVDVLAVDHAEKTPTEN
jgi:uncharacterized protein (TIGR03435 family)